MDENLHRHSETRQHGHPGDQPAVLDLLYAQINGALQDLSQSESEIIEFFNHTRYQVDGLVEWIDEAEEKSLEMAAAHASLTRIKNAADRSIQHLQAFDRVEQRLRHVMENLEQLSQVSDFNAPYLIDLFEASYSLEHELQLIRLVREGASKQELVNCAAAQHTQSGGSELF